MNRIKDNLLNYLKDNHFNHDRKDYVNCYGFLSLDSTPCPDSLIVEDDEISIEFNIGKTTIINTFEINGVTTMIFFNGKPLLNTKNAY